ncbi:ubiquitin-related domain-containing protein [Mycena sanguinolenta]|nr:ubiquitin-related domain-containing protein [Mycena sanguinolenta]
MSNMTCRSSRMTKLLSLILFVKMLTGKTLEISISLKAPVLSLKEDIQTKEGISPAHQRLICSGKQLADHLPLSSYNIQNKSILHFVPSLRGGGAFDVAYTVVLYPWDGDMGVCLLHFRTKLPFQRPNVFSILL